MGAAAGIFMIPLNPVHSKLLNLAFLGCFVSAWMGCAILLWKRRRWRFVALIFPLLVGIPFILPGGKIDAEELRHDYVKRMNQFHGTKYVWGGESDRGTGDARHCLRDRNATTARREAINRRRRARAGGGAWGVLREGAG